jgi:hypothetical protein
VSTARFIDSKVLYMDYKLFNNIKEGRSNNNTNQTITPLSNFKVKKLLP